MNDQFYRISRLPPYVFAEVNKMKAAARAAGADIIDFGMGNPDSAPPSHVIDKMRETLKDPKAHRYSLSRGIFGLRKILQLHDIGCTVEENSLRCKTITTGATGFLIIAFNVLR